MKMKADVGHWDALQRKWGTLGGTRRPTEESEVYRREIRGARRCIPHGVNGVILKGQEDQTEASPLHQRANKRPWGASEGTSKPLIQFCVHSDPLNELSIPPHVTVVPSILLYASLCSLCSPLWTLGCPPFLFECL